MTLAKSERPAEGNPKPCLARSVVQALRDNASLSAVSFDRKHHSLSIATLDQTKFPELEERISDTLQHADQMSQEVHCTLLKGEGECLSCMRPLSEQEKQLITISHEPAKTTIARITCPTAPRFWRWKDIPLPKVVPRKIEIPSEEAHLNEWKWQLAAACLCAVFGLAGYASTGPISLGAYVAAYIAGAWFALREVWEKLQQRAIDIHFLMIAVAAGSAAIGAWGEGAMLLFLFSFSGALEHYALGRTQKEIRSLFRDTPRLATLIEDGGAEREIEVASLLPGMRLLLKPGAQFPVDAEISKGQTAADESNLTGESLPVEKTVGDHVLAGTLNLWGAVEAIVLRPAAQSSLQKIIHLIQQAQQRKAPSQQFTDKFSTYYTYAALGGSILMFFVWIIFGHPPFRSAPENPSAFYRAMTLLVVASPCALVLSIPSAVLAAIAWGARHGILFRGGAAVEKLAHITTVALDKTGTLTTGELRVETVESFPPGQEAQIQALAYSLEKLSEHPLARAVTRFGKQQHLKPRDLTNFQSVTGQGLSALSAGQPCFVGKAEWVSAQSGSSLPREKQQAQPGLCEVWVASGPLLGRIILRDDIRAGARPVVDAIRAEGLETIVLTGDHEGPARQLCNRLGLANVRFGLTPEDKLNVIRQLSASGQKVAMVGDGVNDAPSLAAAEIGVAMGARGADAALEQADVVLMHDRLENFLAALRLSKRARSIIRQNLVISLGTVIVLVLFALQGKIPLTLGVLGHEGSTLLVVMNSLRLLFHRSHPPSNLQP